MISIIIRLILFVSTVKSLVPIQDLDQHVIKPEKCYGTDEIMDAKCCLFPPFFVREIARECGALFSLKHRSAEHNITTFRRESMTVGTPKEEAKSLTMLLNNIFKKALRGIKHLKNYTQVQNGVINKFSYRTIKSERKMKKPGRSRKRKSTIKRTLAQNYSPPLNYSSTITPLSSRNNSADRSWTCILDKYHLLNEDKTLNMDRYHLHLDKWIELNPAFYKAVHEGRSKCKYRFHMYLPLKAEEYFTFQSCIRSYVNMHCPQMIKSDLCDRQKQFYEECAEYFF